ncbi:Hypothetical predicted protein [Mytilus galloprovincialis]|uniref:Uncharacterized protein n=1 Tax=Mytilus galloprovincialis TaxID=29158 RepID=A0A8B6DYH1_MYTGA|nr:Hypothetical predicted protein [Mytilus galloprovincialis]
MSFDNTQISEHDKEVLDRLFNPNLPYGDVVEDNKDTSPSEEEVETEEIKQVKILEADGVKAANCETFTSHWTSSLRPFNVTKGIWI